MSVSTYGSKVQTDQLNHFAEETLRQKGIADEAARAPKKDDVRPEAAKKRGFWSRLFRREK